MSGIAGIIRFDGGPVAPGLVEQMTGAMRYRGPDGIRHWTQGSVALGHCMLRTTPESLEETQPLANEDESLVLVMDGRVDNWEALRTELLARGARLRTRADAELVLRAYETWGKDCLAHIDGDFALVIWDARKREAFCARDRIGNKPFYYHWDGVTLAFATELRPVFDLPWVPRTPNTGVLAEYLATSWHSRDETPWSGILRLPPAQQTTVRGSKAPSVTEYWAPRLDAELNYKSDEEYFEHYESLFADCVRRSARSHLPLSFEVSGGLDSSAVFCMADRLLAAGTLPAPGMEGYTLAFTEPGAANELAYARAVGAHLGRPIHEIAPSRFPLSWYADMAAANRNFPCFPNAAMFVEMRNRMHAAGSRVVLTGEGGDEWLQGSRLYYAEALAGLDGRGVARAFLADRRAAGTRQALRWLAQDGVYALLPQDLQHAVKGTYRRLRYGRGTSMSDGFWLSEPIKAEVRRRRTLAAATRQVRRRHLGRAALDAMRLDAFSDIIMATGEVHAARAHLEIRTPMRMASFIELAFALPERMRLVGDTAKFIHVGGLRSLLPRPILERTDKADFGIVFREALAPKSENIAAGLLWRHPQWFSDRGLENLVGLLTNQSSASWPNWTLWSMLMCDYLYCE